MRYSIENSLAVGLAVMVTAVAAGHHDRQKSPLNPSTSPVTDDNMGPASMLWPLSRVWTRDMDNTAPCGSSAAIAQRTRFPMSMLLVFLVVESEEWKGRRMKIAEFFRFTEGAKVSLVAQDDYYDSQISISYKKDPKENSDFTALTMNTASMNDLNPGHTCVDVPDAPTDLVSPGTNATIQVIYRSNWDKPENQTFYVCADITYVPLEEFDDNMMCFNATVPGEDDQNPPWIKKVDKKPFGGGPNDKTPGTASAPAIPSEKPLLSGGDIAGIVIGSLAALTMVVGVVVILVRRSQQKKRRNQHIARMENARQDQGPMEKHDSVNA
ncbi:hypothetical protein CP533_2458 [Ophiocordyceps camponoti-saundersi (nom. inval.)]|nr:hypothetical protein CP533_2458 [Ophiocordyceps camponoti-saundersi (nom. inval.)]